MELVMAYGIERSNLLSEVKIFGVMRNIIMQPKEGITVHHHSGVEAYQSWLKINCCACFTMLNNMHIDIIGKFRNYPTIQDI